MREEIANRDLPRGFGIGELKIGIEISDAIIPADLSRSHERGENAGGDRLRKRSNFKDCVGIDLRRFTNLAYAISAEKHDLAVVDDGDGNCPGLSSCPRLDRM